MLSRCDSSHNIFVLRAVLFGDHNIWPRLKRVSRRRVSYADTMARHREWKASSSAWAISRKDRIKWPDTLKPEWLMMFKNRKDWVCGAPGMWQGQYSARIFWTEAERTWSEVFDVYIHTRLSVQHRVRHVLLLPVYIFWPLVGDEHCALNIVSMVGIVKVVVFRAAGNKRVAFWLRQRAQFDSSDLRSFFPGKTYSNFSLS